MHKMSYGSTKKSGSSASRRSLDGDTPEEGGDDRDESKRRSRNLSEKKRRDQFNILINELCSMVSTSPRKMDKSTVLKATIAFLKAHNELSNKSQMQETQENWKPSFLSNEEFTHLMLEALDGFIAVISDAGKILHVSETVISLLGYLPSDLVNATIYHFIPPEERSELRTVLNGAGEAELNTNFSVVINFRLGGLEMNEENQKFQRVKFVGYFKRWVSPSNTSTTGTGSETATERSDDDQESTDSKGNSYVFIATGRLLDADLLREMSIVVDSAKNEFCSRHSLEWKFLFLDHRAPPIIGYLPFEVLGTSGYDYYHVDDLEKVAHSHQALMHKGEGTSCYYRFLTKGQQWIWLQTRYYITYHQWNSKPEFIVCTHRVVSYADVMKELRMTGGRGRNSHLVTSAAKGPKSEPKKNSLSTGYLRGSSRFKNQENFSYGSIPSNRTGAHRKLDLPPKFASALSSSHPTLHQLPHPHQLAQPNLTVSSPISPSVMCSQSLTPSSLTSTAATSSFNSHMPQIVIPNQLPVNSTQLSTSSPTQELAHLPCPPSSSIAPFSNQGYSVHNQDAMHGNPGNTEANEGTKSFQEQLILKHSELQRQILKQQEELRRVSEQLLMAQCGMIPPNDGSVTDHGIVPSVVSNSLTLSNHSSQSQTQVPILSLQSQPQSINAVSQPHQMINPDASNPPMYIQYPPQLVTFGHTPSVQPASYDGDTALT